MISHIDDLSIEEAVKKWGLNYTRSHFARLRDRADNVGQKEEAKSWEAKRREAEEVFRRMTRRYWVTDYIAADGARFEIHFDKARGLHGHCAFETGDLHRRHATPAQDIDYVEANGGPLGCLGACCLGPA